MKILNPFVSFMSVVLFISPAGNSGAAEKASLPSVYLEVRADRDDALYQVGEKIVFKVKALTCTISGNQAVKAKNAEPVAGVKLVYRITGDGGLELTGNLESRLEPVTVECVMPRPGFVLCTVGEETLPQWWQYRGRGGAGVEPLKIAAGVTVPADFDEFWAESLKELDKVSMADTVIKEMPDMNSGAVKVCEVRIPTLGAGRENLNPYVTGYLCKPANAKPKSCPARLHLPGAGVKKSSPPAADSARDGTINLAISVHGIDVGGTAEYYKEQRKTIDPLYKNSETVKAEALRYAYFRTIFLRVVRALQFLEAQPEWDGKTLIISGGSQGGGLALIGAGLHPRVTACMADFPGFCDQYGYLLQKPNGWPQMIKLDKNGKPADPMAVETAAYFDAANFARRLKMPVAVSVGFIDTTCPPSSVYAAYNLIPSEAKRITNGPASGHEGPKWDRAGFIRQQLGKPGGTVQEPGVQEPRDEETE